MGLVAKQAGNFEPIPKGIHQGVCYLVVDLGTQYNRAFDKLNHKVVIGWEISSQRIMIDGADLPRVMSKQYTLSLYPKSALRKDLTTWRGKQFTSEELKGFDLKNLLGANCHVQVLHVERDGKTYANVESITRLMEGISKKESETPHVFYSIDDNGEQVPAEIPKWMAETIRKSEEFKNFANPFPAEAQNPPQETHDSFPDDDEIPF